MKWTRASLTFPAADGQTLSERSQQLGSCPLRWFYQMTKKKNTDISQGSVRISPINAWVYAPRQP